MRIAGRLYLAVTATLVAACCIVTWHLRSHGCDDAAERRLDVFCSSLRFELEWEAQAYGRYAHTHTTFVDAYTELGLGSEGLERAYTLGRVGRELDLCMNARKMGPPLNEVLTTQIDRAQSLGMMSDDPRTVAHGIFVLSWAANVIESVPLRQNAH